MALILKPKGEATIDIPGADISFKELYVRIEFAGRMDGKLLEIAPMSFMNRDKFIEGKPIVTNVPTTGFHVNIDVEIEAQSLETAHKYAKKRFEELGYEVSIDL
jgi:hypothetical protein